MKHEQVIYGSIPSKSNQYQIITIGGHSSLGKTSTMKDFEKKFYLQCGAYRNKNNGIIEIKCPFNPTIHLRHYLYEVPEDLKTDNLQYYVQTQYNMICVEREFGYKVDYCDFISYDPRTSKSKQLKVLRIPADKEMQKLLIERTELAVSYLRDQVERINNMESIINHYKKE